MTSESTLHLIALSMIEQIGPISARQLIAYTGSPEGVFKASKRELSKIPGIGELRASSIKRSNVLHAAEKEMHFIQREDIRVLSYLDDHYPRRLKVLEDMPIMLYYKGKDILNLQRSIGIVGTRKPTIRGKEICSRIVSELKDLDVVIISGLAYGIDVTAHRSAMDMGLPTAGVMGTGFDIIYPASHRNVARQMLECGGLLTEFTSGLRLDPERFPMRNRILAGLSDVLIVVESGAKGGSMITAQMAFDYNKDVFAIPGRPGDEMSAGPNLLIQSNRAQLIRNGRDVIDQMMWESNEKKGASQRKLFEELSEDEHVVCKAIGADKDIHIDLIQTKTSFTQSKLAGILLNLEFRGIIRSLPGKRFYLIR